MFPVINDKINRKRIHGPSVDCNKNDSKNEEPSAKKSFSFTAATLKSNEGTTTSAPNFMVGSGAGSPASSVFPASNSGSANFVFKPASATVSAAPTPSSQTPLFSFGATSGSKNAAGPGFSSPYFGAKPAETKPNLNFGAAPKTTETSEPAKFAFGSSTVGPNFGASTNSSTTPSFGSPAPTTTNSPAFGSNPVTASSGMPLFGAGQNAAAPSAFMFGQQQQQQQQPAATAAAPPRINPNIRPTFNFMSGAAPSVYVFSATPSAQTSSVGPQRRYKKDMRRIPQAPPRPTKTNSPAFGANPVTSSSGMPLFGAGQNAASPSVFSATGPQCTDKQCWSAAPLQERYAAYPPSSTPITCPLFTIYSVD